MIRLFSCGDMSGETDAGCGDVVQTVAGILSVLLMIDALWLLLLLALQDALRLSL
jgi:hypothetical protein